MVSRWWLISRWHGAPTARCAQDQARKQSTKVVAVAGVLAVLTNDDAATAVRTSTNRCRRTGVA